MSELLTPILGEDCPPGVFWKPSEAFVRELADWLKGRRVLEVFAGNGFLASVLAKQGIEIKATSLLSGMDAHRLGLYHSVEHMNALEAVNRYRDSADVLLICWPTVTQAVIQAAMAWGESREICYVGEVTDYSKRQLGGCATDEFFSGTHVTHEFKFYRGNALEHAQVRRLKLS